MRRTAAMIERVWRLTATKWFLLFTVCFLLAMDAYGVSFFPRNSIDASRVGDLGTWFAGIATAGAVIVAGSSLRRDRVEAELERTSRERAATGEIYCWVEVRPLRPGRKSPVLLVANRTAGPVFDWEVTLSNLTSSVISHESYGPLLPGERIIELDEDDFARAAGSSTVRSSISFTSALGNRLTRNSSGLLMEADR